MPTPQKFKSKSQGSWTQGSSTVGGRIPRFSTREGKKETRRPSHSGFALSSRLSWLWGIAGGVETSAVQEPGQVQKREGGQLVARGWLLLQVLPAASCKGHRTRRSSTFADPRQGYAGGASRQCPARPRSMRRFHFSAPSSTSGRTHRLATTLSCGMLVRCHSMCSYYMAGVARC